MKARDLHQKGTRTGRELVTAVDELATENQVYSRQSLTSLEQDKQPVGHPEEKLSISVLQ